MQTIFFSFRDKYCLHFGYMLPRYSSSLSWSNYVKGLFINDVIFFLLIVALNATLPPLMILLSFFVVFVIFWLTPLKRGRHVLTAPKSKGQQHKSTNFLSYLKNAFQYFIGASRRECDIFDAHGEALFTINFCINKTRTLFLSGERARGI